MVANRNTLFSREFPSTLEAAAESREAALDWLWRAGLVDGENEFRVWVCLEEAMTNGSLRLCGLTRQTREVFEITNLDKVFVIYEGDETGSVKRYERVLRIADEEAAWHSKFKVP